MEKKDTCPQVWIKSHKKTSWIDGEYLSAENPRQLTKYDIDCNSGAIGRPTPGPLFSKAVCGERSSNKKVNQGFLRLPEFKSEILSSNWLQSVGYIYIPTGTRNY